MRNRRFRNHGFIIIEKMGGSLLALGAFAFSTLLHNFEEIRKLDISLQEDGKWLFLLFGALGLFLFGLCRCILLWYKTWIEIKDEWIIVERNTWNQKKNTVSIRNISNIHLEQSFFEGLLGICTLKIDTNSRTTAEETDIRILLKKQAAKQLQTELQKELKGGEGKQKAEDDLKEEETKYAEGIKIKGKEVLYHGCYSIHLLSLIVFLGGMLALFDAVVQIEASMLEKTVMEAAAGILVLVIAIVSALADFIRGFVRYYGFQVMRQEEHLYISYGFFKKVEHMVPIGKIQAVKLKQGLLARILHKYKAELINIGMKEDGEETSFLLLYADRETIVKRLAFLLPEFKEIAEKKEQRQPKSAWLAWSLGWGIYLFLIAGAGLYVLSVWKVHTAFICIMAVLMIFLALFLLFLKHISSGFAQEKEFIKASYGFFTKTIVMVSCQKLQHIELSQNIIAKRLGIQKGKLCLLASAMNTVHKLPYMNDPQARLLEKSFLSTKGCEA